MLCSHSSWYKITVDIIDCQLGETVSECYGNTVEKYQIGLHQSNYQHITFYHWRA